MILRKYPDSISSLKNNFIIHFSSARTKAEKHLTPLSIKCSMKGAENHFTSDGNYNVTSGNYLILNEGQECTSEIDSTENVETFSIYFERSFANSALKEIITPGDKLLNISFNPDNQPVQFFEKLYSHNSVLSPSIMKLRLASKVNFDDRQWIDEQFYEVLEKLLVVHRELYKEIEKLPPLKFSTKTELYRRVHKAKEFIDSNFTDNISLELIARQACLSQFHFLRTFKSVFKKTPHQYLTDRRLEKITYELRRTDIPITEICLGSGFESPGTFSWMFRKKYGISPEEFRNRYKNFLTKLAISKK